MTNQARAGNASLAQALRDAIAGTRLESQCIEATLRENATVVARAQFKRRRAAYRARRRQARRESVEQARQQQPTK